MGNDLAHVCICVEDVERMTDFYLSVFGGEVVPPERHLFGPWFERFSGVPGAELTGKVVMTTQGLLVELFNFKDHAMREKTLTASGFSHIAFIVDDVEATYEKFMECGGLGGGQVTSHYYESRDMTLTAVYVKDPEGNYVEIMHWSPGRLESAI